MTTRQYGPHEPPLFVPRYANRNADNLTVNAGLLLRTVLFPITTAITAITPVAMVLTGTKLRF